MYRLAYANDPKKVSIQSQMRRLIRVCTVCHDNELSVMLGDKKLDKIKSCAIHDLTLTHNNASTTVLPIKSDRDVMFCLQSYQGLLIDRLLVYLSYSQDRINT